LIAGGGELAPGRRCAGISGRPRRGAAALIVLEAGLNESRSSWSMPSAAWRPPRPRPVRAGRFDGGMAARPRCASRGAHPI